MMTIWGKGGNCKVHWCLTAGVNRDRCLLPSEVSWWIKSGWGQWGGVIFPGWGQHCGFPSPLRHYWLVTCPQRLSLRTPPYLNSTAEFNLGFLIPPAPKKNLWEKCFPSWQPTISIKALKFKAFSRTSGPSSSFLYPSSGLWRKECWSLYAGSPMPASFFWNRRRRRSGRPASPGSIIQSACVQHLPSWASRQRKSSFLQHSGNAHVFHRVRGKSSSSGDLLQQQINR